MFWFYVVASLIMGGVSGSVALNEVLIGGSQIPTKDFPEIVYLVNSAGARCSGVVVGPRVIMTAAHCIDKGNNVKSYYPNADIQFNAQCTKIPGYDNFATGEDFALCKNVAGPIEGAKPVPVVGKAFKVSVGMPVTLSGFGCIHSDSPGHGSGGNDGILRYGDAPVVMGPKNGRGWVWTQSEVAVCFGDSGGPGFVKIKNATDHTERHRVLGINARGDIRTNSFLSPVFTPSARNFMNKWAKKHGVIICGVNRKCPGLPKTILEDEFLEDEIED